uniref:Protein kinase domain-containing protein n=1 Tax=Macrostomum lignano TaxID=282301 RepID=A0A1I8F7T6_9PLAT
GHCSVTIGAHVVHLLTCRSLPKHRCRRVASRPCRDPGRTRSALLVARQSAGPAHLAALALPRCGLGLISEGCLRRLRGWRRLCALLGRRAEPADVGVRTGSRIANPNLIRGNQRVILTPNWLGILPALRVADPPIASSSSSTPTSAGRLSAALGGVCILLKGREDVVAAGAGSDNHSEVCALQAAPAAAQARAALLAGLALRELAMLRHPALLAAYAARRTGQTVRSSSVASRRRANHSGRHGGTDRSRRSAGCFLRPTADQAILTRDFEADQDKCRRRKRYRLREAGDSERRRSEDDDIEGAKTQHGQADARERERLRRRLLGVGLPVGFAFVGVVDIATAAALTTAFPSKRVSVEKATAAAASSCRLATELPRLRERRRTSQQQQQAASPDLLEMQKNPAVRRLQQRRPRGGKKAKPGDSNPRVKLRDKFPAHV